MKIKERLSKAVKNMIPLEMLYFMKYHSKLRQKKRLNIPVDGKRVFLLDSPHYGNIGDQAIAYSIKKFQQKYFDDYFFVDIQQEELPHYIDELKKSITPDDIIFMVGGGNMGNIYRIFEATRRIVIREFPNNKIVIFPQTLEYTDNFFGKLSARKSQRIYNKHGDLTILAREEMTYKKLQSMYHHCKVFLCPDIVLSLNVNFASENRKGIGVCLRNDCEQRLTADEKTDILRFLSSMEKPIYEVTTAADIGYITSDMREEIVLSKIKEISQFELLITDRLHAMIFAAVSQTPCIAFNNTNKKVEGVYKWISERSYIKLVNNIEEFHDALSLMQDVHVGGDNDLNVFEQLAEFIKGVSNATN